MDIFGDLTGDGLPELVVGAAGALANAGEVAIFASDPGHARLWRWVGDPGDRLSLVTAIGDADGDGMEDMLLGAQTAHSTAAEAGKVRIISGAELVRSVAR